MAQVTDRTVGANPTGFDMRTELNNIIGALESDNSGSSEPLNTVAYMKWLDTSDATYYYYKERNHDNTAWVTLFRYTVATKIMEAVSNGVVLSQTDIASEIHASSSKTTPVDADEIGILDSVSSTLQKLTWSNLKATLKTYFDTLYVTLSGDETIAGVKTFSSSPIVPVPTLANQAISMGNIIEKTGVGIGYGTGSGGNVTQLTSKSTTVTLNKPCGKIIMNGESLAAGATVVFSCNNTLASVTDSLSASFVYNGVVDYIYYNLWWSIQTNNIVFYLKNVSLVDRAHAVEINFAITKGVTA